MGICSRTEDPTLAFQLPEIDFRLQFKEKPEKNSKSAEKIRDSRSITIPCHYFHQERDSGKKDELLWNKN